MPAPTGYPALYLYPLNDSFVPKHISLIQSQRVKIGRQTNAKTTPGERNGYFDSKVLSRQHAEVWEEGGKIFIKDVKSSNGTFINGERLSPEGLESDPYELKSDDIVEFGIDIVGEDNKTIIHHKVAARVLCILTEQDFQMAARAEQHQMQHSSLQQQQQQQQQQPHQQQLPGPGASTFNFAANGTQQQQQPPPRRPQMSQQGMAGMGGMGASMRAPGKSGLTFDHILTRLQGELQKSRETGAELHSLTGAMNEIHDTLGAGNLPHNPPPNPHTLPPVRDPAAIPLPPSSSSPPPEPHPTNTNGEASSSSSPPPPNNAISVLQTQLEETQSSLAAHVDRVRALEGALKEQESIRNEVGMLREMMDALQRREREWASSHPPEQAHLSRSTSSHASDNTVAGDLDENDEDDVDDDTRSVATVVPHELERVDEEDEEAALDEDDDEDGRRRQRVDELDVEEASHQDRQPEQEEEEEEEERRRRRDELGRPRTPEPTGMGIHVKINGHHRPETRNRSSTLTGRSQNTSIAVVDELSARLASFTSQLEAALELSKGLQKEHKEAQEVIRGLEAKVESLEGIVKKQQAKEEEARAEAEAAAAVVPETPTAPTEEEKTSSLTSMILEWKSNVEGQWSSVREEWTQERQRLVRARVEWENKMKGEWERKVKEVDTGLDRLEKLEKELIQDRVALEKDRTALHDAPARIHANGEALKYRGVGLVTPPSPRSVSSDYDYTSSPTWTGRPRKRSRSASTGRRKIRALGRSSSRGADTDDTEETLAVDEHPLSLGKDLSSSAPGSFPTKAGDGHKPLITPESSLIFAREHSASDKDGSGGSSRDHGPLDSKHSGLISVNNINVQTAVGVLVLSVAAAAVVWRVKPE